jgi:hypothetical protein
MARAMIGPVLGKTQKDAIQWVVGYGIIHGMLLDRFLYAWNCGWSWPGLFILALPIIGMGWVIRQSLVDIGAG